MVAIAFFHCIFSEHFRSGTSPGAFWFVFPLFFFLLFYSTARAYPPRFLLTIRFDRWKVFHQASHNSQGRVFFFYLHFLRNDGSGEQCRGVPMSGGSHRAGLILTKNAIFSFMPLCPSFSKRLHLAKCCKTNAHDLLFEFAQ